MSENNPCQLTWFCLSLDFFPLHALFGMYQMFSAPSSTWRSIKDGFKDTYYFPYFSSHLFIVGKKLIMSLLLVRKKRHLKCYKHKYISGDSHMQQVTYKKLINLSKTHSISYTGRIQIGMMTNWHHLKELLEYSIIGPMPNNKLYWSRMKQCD